MNGGDTKREPRKIDPVLLRGDAIAGLRSVSVGVDKSWQNHLAAYIDHGGTRRDLDFGARAYLFDSIAFDKDRGILDDSSI